MCRPIRNALVTAALVFSSPSIAEATCTKEVGATAAQDLVNRCRNVSPATHPPCNAANSCALIRAEISRAEAYIAKSDEQQIRSQRAAFNRALAAGNVRGIAPILADDAQLVTGADSMIVSGKAAQLALWTEDLGGPNRRFYVRKPTRIRVSPVGPMALETGEWRGFQMSARHNWSSGDYVAKWRRIGGTWKIESETYMSTACGGSFCPTGGDGRDEQALPR